MDRMIFTGSVLDYNDVVIKPDGGEEITDYEGNVMEVMPKYSRVEVTVKFGFKSYAPITEEDKKVMADAVLYNLIKDLNTIAW